MISQNYGFALAVAAGDADRSDYEAVEIPRGELPRAWIRSVEMVSTAFENADLSGEVRLVEIRPEATFPVTAVVGMHLLDTVVHTWDIASSLGVDFRPDDELVDIVASRARRIPVGAARTGAGALFGPPRDAAVDDPWLAALALLGRDGAPGAAIAVH